MEFFGLSPEERVPCERCWKAVAVDVHHCERRGMGGDPTGSKDRIENLGGVCRACHEILDSNPDENDTFKIWCANLHDRKKKMKKVMYGG
jgi:hypothetical protein